MCDRLHPPPPSTPSGPSSPHPYPIFSNVHGWNLSFVLMILCLPFLKNAGHCPEAASAEADVMCFPVEETTKINSFQVSLFPLPYIYVVCEIPTPSLPLPLHPLSLTPPPSSPSTSSTPMPFPFRCAWICLSCSLCTNHFCFCFFPENAGCGPVAISAEADVN